MDVHQLPEPNPRSPHVSPTRFHNFGLAPLPLVARVLGLGDARGERAFARWMLAAAGSARAR